MADFAKPFGTVALSAINQTAQANALFDALFMVGIYALNRSTTSGTNLGLSGGKLNIGGTITIIDDVNVTLTTSSTNYVQANPSTGAVSVNTTGYTPGYLRIGRATTNASGIVPGTGWVDDRHLGFGIRPKLLTKAFPSDANYTLTAAEADVDYIKVSSGTITATRDLIVPVAFPKEWTVINGNAQSVRIIGATGTGITIATGKTAKVFADGTNVVRVTADT